MAFLSHNINLLNIALAELVIAMYGREPASDDREIKGDDGTAKRREEVEMLESLVDGPVVCEDCER